MDIVRSSSEERLNLALEELQDLNFRMKRQSDINSSSITQVQQQLRRQWEIIRTLEKQKSELMLNLRCLESESLTSENNIYYRKLSNILTLQDSLQQTLCCFNEKIQSVNKKIAEVDKQLNEKRMDIVVVHRNQDQIMGFQKKISLLENRLSHCTAKYDELLHSNSVLQEQINSMLQMQVTFDKNFREVKNLIDCGQKTIKNITHTATVAYKDSEQAKYRILVLNERTQVDQKKLAEQIKELRFLLEKNEKLNDFLKLKQDVSTDREEICSFPAKSLSLENTINTYYSILSRLQGEASIRDTKYICQHYKQLEENNFVLFNRVKEMNCEIEKLNETVRALQKEAEIVQRQYKELERKDLTLKREFDTKLNKTTWEAHTLEAETDIHGEMLECLKVTIRKMCRMTGCNSSAECNDVTDENVLNCLQDIESKIVTYIQCSKYLQYKKRKSSSNNILPNILQLKIKN